MKEKIQEILNRIAGSNIYLELKKEKNLVIILLLASFFLFFFMLGAPSLFETDEVIYSQIAREMRRTGDWITLHFRGENWFIHPPMYMWLVTASSYVLGDSEFNSRLWGALFALATVFVTYLLGKKMFKPGIGILAGFILATSFQFIIQARMAIFDPPLVFFMLLAVYLFFLWRETGNDKLYYWSFASMGFATLIKGPIGFLLPGLVVIPFLFTTKGLPSLFNRRFYKGALLTLFIGGTWYLIESIIHGEAFISRVIGYYLVNRYTGIVEAHTGPWFYYFPVILLGFFPWSIFLPFSLFYQGKKRDDKNNLFILMWIGIVFIFFSLAGTKLPGYILSLYPFMALSVSKFLYDFADGFNHGYARLIGRIFKVFLVLSIIFAIVSMIFGSVDVQPDLKVILSDVNMMILIVGLGGIAASIFYLSTGNIFSPVVVLIITMLTFTFYTAKNTMVNFDELKPMRAISRIIIKEHETGDKIVVFNRAGHSNSFVFYLDKPIVWADKRSALSREISTNKRYFLIATRKDYYTVVKKVSRSLYMIGRSGDLVILSNQE